MRCQCVDVAGTACERKADRRCEPCDLRICGVCRVHCHAHSGDQDGIRTEPAMEHEPAQEREPAYA